MNNIVNSQDTEIETVIEVDKEQKKLKLSVLFFNYFIKNPLESLINNDSDKTVEAQSQVEEVITKLVEFDDETITIPMGTLPIEHVIEDEEVEAVIVPVKKPRGRPRKDRHEKIQSEVGKIVHVMEDDAINFKTILPDTIHKIKLDFKEYLEEGLSITTAIKMITTLYKIPYQPAHRICHKFF